jgi:septal ring-binding cell division protein DamX
MTFKLTRFCSLALILCTIGCGGTNLPVTVSVTGKVTYQDKPVDGAQVVLNNIDPAGKPASGITDAQGNFAVQTYVDPTAQARGAVPGSYKVTVTKTEKSSMSSTDMMNASAGGTKPVGPKNLLPEKYASVTTTDLPAEIKKGTSEVLKLELKD